MGRPRKLRKQINPVRQVGRWTNADWQLIRDAAAAADAPDVASWARATLLAAARRLLKTKPQ